MSETTMTPESSSPSGRALKRTRICGPQSKNGCFTCKRRRIKCDEDKPRCQRCVRSKVDCEGYPERAAASRIISRLENRAQSPVSDLSESEEAYPAYPTLATTRLAPRFAIRDRCNDSFTQERLARVGVNLLSHGLSDQFDFATGIFNGLLPQLSYAIPSVNAAAAALGAIYELQSTAASTGKSDECNAIAATQYGLAVKLMQQDLQIQRFGTVPLLMICTLLACSELLLRRRSYSLMHIQAGFKLLEQRRERFSALSSSEEDDAPITRPGADEDEIFLLFRTFDIHSSTYADRRMPTMPTPHLWLLSTDLSETVDPHTLGLDLISTIHKCLYFTSNAGQYKYLPASNVPSEILIEQGRHLGILNTWLTRLDRYLMQRSALDTLQAKSKGRRHLLMLRNMCLSTIILASTILSPYETAWDDYSWYFEEIVSGADEILTERARARPRSPELNGKPRKDKTYAGDSDFAFTFTPLPGVIQPLCLTAFKYRHSTYRRRAAQLMRMAGREGPWIGELVAAVADRLIEVEEAEAQPDVDPNNAQVLWDNIYLLAAANGPSSIPERARISGVGMDANINRNKSAADHDSRNWTARRSGETRARFFRCRNVQGMLDAGLGAGGPGSLSPWSSIDNEPNDALPNGGRPAWNDERYWEDWNEVLKF